MGLRLWNFWKIFSGKDFGSVFRFAEIGIHVYVVYICIGLPLCVVSRLLENKVYVCEEFTIVCCYKFVSFTRQTL